MKKKKKKNNLVDSVTFIICINAIIKDRIFEVKKLSKLKDKILKFSVGIYYVHCYDFSFLE